MRGLISSIASLAFIVSILSCGGSKVALQGSENLQAPAEFKIVDGPAFNEVTLSWQDTSSEDHYVLTATTIGDGGLNGNWLRTFEANTTQTIVSGIEASAEYVFSLEACSKTACVQAANTVVKAATSSAGPRVVWQKLIGYSRFDIGYEVKVTTDGGLLLVGYTYKEVYGSGSEAAVDGLVVKLDSNGNKDWERKIAGTGNDYLVSAVETSDGYIVAGYTNSNLTGVDTVPKDVNVYLAKLDLNGQIVWQKIIGGSLRDYAQNLIATSTGQFLMLGYTNSPSSDVAPEPPNIISGTCQSTCAGYDYYLVRFDGSGTVKWQYRFGGSGADYGKKVIQTSDGAYVMAGYSNSSDLPGAHGLTDGYVIKVREDSSGKPNIKEYEATFGGTEDDNFTAVIESPFRANDLYFAGSSKSATTGTNHGGEDSWLVHLYTLKGATPYALSGQVLFGGSWRDAALSLIEIPNRGVLSVGFSESDDLSGTENHGDYDGLISRIDYSRNLEAQLLLGGSGKDMIYSIDRYPDGSFAVAGYSYSPNLVGTSYIGGGDLYVAKLRMSGL